jgi:hypothetical protein
MLSPIQLIEHRFGETHLVPTPNLTAPEREQRVVSCRHELGWQQGGEDSKRWRLRLQVELLPAEENHRSPYTGRVEAIGEFQIHEDFPVEKREALARMNGGAMLYGAIREWVCTLTSRSLNGMIELPAVDPRCFLQNPDEREPLRVAE